MVKKAVSESDAKAVSISPKVNAKPKVKKVNTSSDSIKQADDENIKIETQALFPTKKDPTLFDTMKKYSPVFAPLLVGLMTYFYLVFFVFYPDIIISGNYLKLLLFVMFLFLLGGIFLYLGLRSEQVFVRIIGFIFVFVVFSFMVLFILLSKVMMKG